MKKSDMKNVYGEVPLEFHNAVVRTLNRLEEVQTVKPSNRVSYVKRALVCAVVMSLVVGGAVAAKAIFPMTASKSGDYGLSIELDSSSKDAPEFVKMNIGWLPESVTEFQGKYSLNGEGEEKCFTITHSRVVEEQPFSDLDVVDYNELEINSHRVIIANVACEPFSKRFYVYFEKEAVFVVAYVTGDVTDDEIKTVIENITVEECTEEESNCYSLTDAKEQLKEAKWLERQEKLGELIDIFKGETVIEYSDITLGQSVAFESIEGTTENTVTVNKIKFLDNVTDLDKRCFRDTAEWSDYTDENGCFVPYERDYYRYGDGVNEPLSKVVKTDTAKKKLVYAELKITNPTDEVNTFFFQGFGIKYDVDSQSDLPSSVIPLGVNVMSEVDFIDKNNSLTKTYHDFYFLDIAPNTTETVHIGFLADEDMIDKAYLEIDANWSNNITFDSEKSAFVYEDTEKQHGAARIKVQ